MSFRRVCLVVLELCALLLCAGCAEQEALFFVTDRSVYVLPAEGEPQLVYECTGRWTARGLCLVGRTPYLLDGETLYRIERNLTVTRLFDLEGANDASMGMTCDGFQSSRHFAVTENGGVVTAYYQDHKNPGELDGAASLNQLGEATQTIVAKSSDGAARRYEVPMQAQSGFAVTDTVILTTQSYVSAPEGRKKISVYVGLCQTDLATGETQLLQKMRKVYDRETYDLGDEYAVMTGEAAMYMTQPDNPSGLQMHYLWGSTGQTLRSMRDSQTALHCQYDDVDAFSDGSDWIRLYQAGSSQVRPYEAGTQIAIIERGEDEAWADWLNGDTFFAMVATGEKIAVTMRAASLEEYYVYVIDRETGQMLQRLLVP